MALGLLAGAGKMMGGKPKEPKLDAKKFAGKKEDVKTGRRANVAKIFNEEQTVKIVDVKPDAQSKSDGSLETLREQTHEVWIAIARREKAKKKKAKLKQRIAEKKKRINKENMLEGVGKAASSVTGGVAGALGVGSLWGNIMKWLRTLFMGWLLNFLPKIINLLKSFVKVVKQIVDFLTPIVKGILGIMHWIADKGVKLVAILVGVKHDQASENSIIKNLTEIQKRVPLIEAAFAAFLVFKSMRVMKKMMPKKGPARVSKSIKGGSRVNKARKLTKTRTASKAARKAFAKRFGGAAAKKRFGGQVAGRSKKVVSKVLGRGLKRGAGRLGIKVLGGRAVKIIGKFAKIPIIGPLIVAISQVLAGEPLGKALFMGVGAGLGGVLGGILAGALGVGTAGFGAVLAPAIMILGEGMGAFVGELLYDGFMGKGWGAAGKKLKDTVMGFLKGTADIFKSIWKWLSEGGLLEVANTIGKGIMAIPGLLAGVFKKVGNGIAIAGRWIGGGVKRFIENFLKETAIEVPSGWGVRGILTKGTKKLGLYDWLDSIGYAGGKDGQIDKFPNLLQLLNPFKFGPLLFKSFFPERAAAAAEQKAAVASGDVAKKNIFGVELSDEHQSEAYLKKRDAGQLKPVETPSTSAKELTSDANVISQSASYDQKGGAGKADIIPIPINQMEPSQAPAGGGGSGGAPASVNKYDTVKSFNKTLVYAKLYRG